MCLCIDQLNFFFLSLLNTHTFPSREPVPMKIGGQGWVTSSQHYLHPMLRSLSLQWYCISLNLLPVHCQGFDTPAHAIRVFHCNAIIGTPEPALNGIFLPGFPNA